MGEAASTAAEAPPGHTLTVRGATVLGVGSMVGAGIFALLGEAGAVAGAAVWISFLVGGVVAGLLGYVCAKLGMTFPSSGGLITYLEKGFGLGRVLGITSWLGYIAAVVVVTAMVAVSFGGYAVSLFFGEGAWSGWDNVFVSALLVTMCALNMVGTKAVAAAQGALVVSVLAVFGVFIVYSRNTGAQGQRSMGQIFHHDWGSWAEWMPFVLSAVALVLGIPVYRRQKSKMTQPGPVPPYREPTKG